MQRVGLFFCTFVPTNSNKIVSFSCATKSKRDSWDKKPWKISQKWALATIFQGTKDRERRLSKKTNTLWKIVDSSCRRAGNNLIKLGGLYLSFSKLYLYMDCGMQVKSEWVPYESRPCDNDAPLPRLGPSASTRQLDRQCVWMCGCVCNFFRQVFFLYVRERERESEK